MDTVLEQEVTVLSEMGLHTRPAAQLAKMVSALNVSVKFSRSDDPATEAEGNSILALLMLAAPRGSKLRIKISGKDSEIALRQITQYFAAAFGDERN